MPAEILKRRWTLVANKILQYGKYSVIRFEKGRNVKKNNRNKPGYEIQPERTGTGDEPKPKNMNLKRIIDNVSDKPIGFLSERRLIITKTTRCRARRN